MAQQVLRTAVITGANRGLGLGLIEHILAEQVKNNALVQGWQILLTARDENKSTQTLQALLKKYPNAALFSYPLELKKDESVNAFVQHIQTKFNNKIDLLFNNAGFLTYDASNSQAARETLETNVHGTINLTEKLWPALTQSAKVIVVSSLLGSQSFQGQYVNQSINRADIKNEDIIALAEEYLKDTTLVNGQLNTQVWEQKWNKSSPYHLSKALISTYVREILSRKVVGDQSAYALTPGWVRTDMGGPGAPKSIEEGVDTMFYVSFELPFKRDAQIHGKFFQDRKVSPW